MNWIDVTKQKPVCNYECHETGLTISDVVLVSDIGSHPSFGMGHINEYGEWNCYNGEHDFMNVLNVTHWMPLPAPPSND